jgi:hypothetical protein
MSEDLTIDVDGEQYVVRQGSEGLRVGRRVAGDVTWLDEVDPALLSEDARAALAEGDTADPALQLAIGGIVQAEIQRGG